MNNWASPLHPHRLICYNAYKAVVFVNESTFKELTNMDWGSFTSEFTRENEMVHVFNHFISTSETVERTIQFIISRIKWCNSYFNNKFVHAVVIDDIGQNISPEIRDHIRKSIKDYVIRLSFASEEK